MIDRLRSSLSLYERESSWLVAVVGQSIGRNSPSPSIPNPSREYQSSRLSFCSVHEKECCIFTLIPHPSARSTPLSQNIRSRVDWRDDQEMSGGVWMGFKCEVEQRRGLAVRGNGSTLSPSNVPVSVGALTTAGREAGWEEECQETRGVGIMLPIETPLLRPAYHCHRLIPTPGRTMVDHSPPPSSPVSHPLPSLLTHKIPWDQSAELTLHPRMTGCCLLILA